MRYLYSLLFYLILPWVFLRLVWRSRRIPHFRIGWKERLGFSPHELDQCILVHAVSLGETIAATPLIKALKDQYPNVPILVTNMTATGSARVKATFGDSVLNAYIPYDLPDAVNRFLNRVNPLIVIIMETELWPNLFYQCREKSIPIVLTNARLSEKSARGYRFIAPLMREMLHDINKINAQAKADAERFVSLGMPSERIEITGNLKFDIEVPNDLSEKHKILREVLGEKRLIWVAASTHPGEEEVILSAHHLVCEKFPNALLILVPRHPERFATVAHLITQQNFSLTKRSVATPASDAQVFLGDSMGEMLLMYSVSDVVFVGGSLVSIGGHNMLEAAVLHKPIITGPHLFNFAEISELLLQANGMKMIKNAEELSETVIDLFQQENKRQTMAEKAYRMVEKNRGALERQLEVIRAVYRRWHELV